MLVELPWVLLVVPDAQDECIALIAEADLRFGFFLASFGFLPELVGIVVQPTG